MTDASSVGTENVQVTRLQRELDRISSTRRDPARHDRDQETPLAFPGDMRLVTKPLVGDDAHANVPCPHCDLLRSDADPCPRHVLERLLRRAVERVAADVKGRAGAHRQAEAAVGSCDVGLKQVHRRFADKAGNEQIRGAADTAPR